MNTIETVTSSLSTIKDYIRWGASRFAEAGLYFGHGTANSLDEAAALILHTLHQPYDLPAGYLDAALTPDERRRLFEAIERRVGERKPVAYLTQQAIFAGLPFYVDERVLVPRSPIAELIERRFQPWVDPDTVTRVLDLCTGSGCIAIACAYAFPDAEVDAVDISAEALEVARINIHRHGVGDQVKPIRSDLFEALAGRRYDVIVSNPPYVSHAEWQALPPEYHHEPRLGFDGGESGLDCLRCILAGAADHLAENGILIVEAGCSAEALQQRYPKVPFCWLEFERGGEGVFLLSADEVLAFHDTFQSVGA